MDAVSLFSWPLFSWTPGMTSGVVLVAAWLLERAVPIARSVDPLAFFHVICDRMAIKVLPASEQTQQHYVSGFLAVIVLIAPILTMLYLIAQLASYPWLLDTLLLYICLQFSPYARISGYVERALQRNKKQLAKDLLQPAVLRDTAHLSSMGLCKATIEMYVLRIQHQQAVVMFWFIVLGPVAALAYRMCLETSQSWNIKLCKFQRFGRFSHLLTSAFQYVPMRVFAVILSVSGLLHPLLRRFKTLFSKSIFLGTNGALTLAAVTGATQISTGGAVMYNGKKIQRSRFLGRREPNVSDIAVVKATCNRAVLVYIGFMLMLSWGLYG